MCVCVCVSVIVVEEGGEGCVCMSVEVSEGFEGEAPVFVCLCEYFCGMYPGEVQALEEGALVHVSVCVSSKFHHHHRTVRPHLVCVCV